MSNHFQDTDPLEEKLIHAGGLRSSDLAFNQAGELSPWQRRWLRLEVAAWIFQIGVDLVLMICAWLFYYFQHNLQIFIIGSIFWGLVLGVSVLFCIEHARPVSDAIHSNEVDSIAGTISKRYSVATYSGKWRFASWSIGIRAHRFNVIPSIYASLVEHGTYRLFYTPSLERVINIEPLLLADQKKQSALAALQARARENKE